ncbi:MAG: hypothetical protein M3433_00125, partial [Actinomycetota bacterium]|nr:hypothetical protein [Actinomycetota bacterium]
MNGTGSTTPGPGEHAGAKRSRLEGGAVTDEALASSEAVLTRTGYSHGPKGLQQFFSPPEAARLAAAVMGADSYGSPLVCDPTAGDGALLRPWPSERRFGIELDSDQVAAGNYHALKGDLQRLYPLLRIAGARFGALVCNPPFGLTWRDPATGTQANSTLLCLRMALGLLEPEGQGVLICGRDRFARELAGRPEAKGVYATVACDDLFEGVELACVLAFFVAPGRREQGETVALEAPRAEFEGMAGALVEARARLCGRLRSYWPERPETVREAFAAVAREHQRRLAVEAERRARHDLE